MQLNINGKIAAIVAASAVACSGLGLAVSEAVGSPAPQRAAIHKVIVHAPPTIKVVPAPGPTIKVMPAVPAPARPPAPPAAPPVSQGYLNADTLSNSIASDQINQLTYTPDSNFDSPSIAAGNGISVYVTVTSNGPDAFTATATDSDGDVGSGDYITVAPDGSSWSDTGMTWTGPDVPSSGWTTNAH